jgi:hemerythrin-like domain-containing protein
MLTATYAVLSLSAEQDAERSFIFRILEYLRQHAGQTEKIDPACLASQLNQLTQFAEARHQPKIENCLIPAVRRATSDADALLADLEALRRVGGNMLRAVRKYMRTLFQRGAPRMERLCRMMELYCHNLLMRLAKEEQELLPLAQRVISRDAWFKIGSTFLSQDASREAGSAVAAVAIPEPAMIMN